mgnify:CR=1 FL=1
MPRPLHCESVSTEQKKNKLAARLFNSAGVDAVITQHLAYSPSLESLDALLSLEELSWLTINLYGTRAEVLVREVVKQPEILEKEGCYDIVAKADDHARDERQQAHGQARGALDAALRQQRQNDGAAHRKRCKSGNNCPNYP